MDNRSIYDRVCAETSRVTTRSFSTSFSLGIATLDRRFRGPIYGIYGFVRFADEIVDTFHDQEQERLLNGFEADTYRAIAERFSIHPILHSFQAVVNNYGIGNDLIGAFLRSMRTDLHHRAHDASSIDTYIYGSAESVGLMCLKVFTENDQALYDSLKAPAMKLGSAFQKVNFLRDLQHDSLELGRTYFPGVDLSRFDEESKRAIELDIAAEFKEAHEGIMRLPKGARAGVRLAYLYYQALFKKIKRMPAHRIAQERVRLPNSTKLGMLVRTYVQHRIGTV